MVAVKTYSDQEKMMLTPAFHHVIEGQAKNTRSAPTPQVTTCYTTNCFIPPHFTETPLHVCALRAA